MAEWNNIELYDWEYELPDGVEPEFTERTYKACWLPKKHFVHRPVNEYVTRIYPAEFVRSMSEQFGIRWHDIKKGDMWQIYPDLFIDSGGQSRNGMGVLVRGTRSTNNSPYVRMGYAKKALEVSEMRDQVQDSADLRKYLMSIREKVSPERYARDFAFMYSLVIEKGDVKSFIALTKVLGVQFSATKVEDLEKPDEVQSLERMIRSKQAELQASKLDDELLKRAKMIDVEDYGYDEAEEDDYEPENQYYDTGEKDWGALWVQKQSL